MSKTPLLMVLKFEEYYGIPKKALKCNSFKRLLMSDDHNYASLNLYE